MHRGHRKPWSRTSSVLSSRWSSFAINPDPAPTPDPQPSPDDDDDDLQVWAGATKLHVNPSDQLFVQALGDAKCGPSGECWSGLFADTPDFTDSYRAGPGKSGSIPPRIGRQVARPYSSDKGGARFQTFMLTPEWETIGQSSTEPCMRHLYFAWLDDLQYRALCNDTDAHSTDPIYDPTDHKMIWFDGDPQFSITQPWVEASGRLGVNNSISVDWLEIRVTLFGIVGAGHDGTPRTWASSQPAKEVFSGEWHFGSPNAPALKGADGWYPSDPVQEVFAVGWGVYQRHGKVHAAVTPPLCSGQACYRPGAGDWKTRAPLPAGPVTTSQWIKDQQDPDNKDPVNFC
jgi:hypothetical protein